MAAGVLNSRGIEVSIFVVRTFVAMREAALNAGSEIAARLNDLERSLGRRFAEHDQAIADIFAAIRALMKEPDAKRRPIGFVRPKEG